MLRAPFERPNRIILLLRCFRAGRIRVRRAGVGDRRRGRVRRPRDPALPQEEEEMRALVKKEMEQVMPLKVPLVVDMGWGENWNDAH